VAGGAAGQGDSRGALWKLLEETPVTSPNGRTALDRCTVCSRQIVVQIFKGTGVCCELCRKRLVREKSR
jgi:hypothetical protein